MRGQPGAAVRVLAKIEAGAVGPDEYAVGVSTRPEAQLDPRLDQMGLFIGLPFAEAHWVAAVLASAAEGVDDAEELLFQLRVPTELTWRDIELSPEVIEPSGYHSAPLVAWSPDDSPGPSRYAIAVYTLTCGHQAVELLRQDPDAAPFWVQEGAVDHLMARDARSLTRLLYGAGSLEEAHGLIESAQTNLVVHVEDDEEADEER